MILSTNLPPVPNVEALEHWRDSISARLALLKREEMLRPNFVEMFEYTHIYEATAAREMLRNLLRNRRRAINTRLSELGAA